jgi:hypothetical protein
MKSTSTIIAALLALSAAPGLSAQKFYGPDFGLTAPIIAAGNEISATYIGWEETTVFGHQIYALTVDQYTNDLGNGCFAFYAIYRAGCEGASDTDLGGLAGDDLFGKPNGVTCAVADPDTQPCLGAPITTQFTWTPGTEIVFALLVNQGDGDYNWFFSGDPTRNNIADGFDGGHAHLAYFASDVYPSGIPTDDDGFVPGTAGQTLFGFEDVGYQNSDWDFNNAIFGIDADTINTPQDVTPEPATLSLLATGLVGLGAAAQRRRRGVLPRA